MSKEPIINENSLRKLVASYNNARKNKDEEFEFKGQKLLTIYAKYMIEYYGREHYVFNRKTHLFSKIKNKV
jgi:hypothetical protein